MSPSRSALATLISTMVRAPLESIAIMSARRPLGSGTSQMANRSCRQNKRVTPRATSAAIGEASWKHESIRVAIAGHPRTKREYPKPLLAVEDVVADRGDALQAPARRHALGVEKQGVLSFGILEILIDDLRDRDGILPLTARAVHRRPT